MLERPEIDNIMHGVPRIDRRPSGPPPLRRVAVDPTPGHADADS